MLFDLRRSLSRALSALVALTYLNTYYPRLSCAPRNASDIATGDRPTPRRVNQQCIPCHARVLDTRLGHIALMSHPSARGPLSRLSSQAKFAPVGLNVASSASASNHHHTTGHGYSVRSHAHKFVYDLVRHIEPVPSAGGMGSREIRGNLPIWLDF